MQPDPLIQAPDNLQSYDRFAFCLSSPMACTDPSGYSWLSKTWKKIWNNKIARTLIIVTAAYFAGSWALEQYATNAAATSGFQAASSAAAAGETAQTTFLAFEHAYASGYAAASSSVAGGAIAGAASGFAGSFVGSNGDLEAGLKGAINGAVSGGINNYYGADYRVSRIAANSVAGGMGAVLRGDSFSSGFRSSAIISSLAYLNAQMREEMIAQSRRDPLNDGTGFSRGMNGDGFKLAGGRWFDGAKLENCSILGCWQNGPGSVFSHAYEKGGFIDMVTESFAGPHDKANSYWWYINSPSQVLEGLGMIGDALPSDYYTKWQNIFLEASTNYTTSLIFAAPFAAGAIVDQSWMTTNFLGTRRRK